MKKPRTCRWSGPGTACKIDYRHRRYSMLQDEASPPRGLTPVDRLEYHAAVGTACKSDSARLAQNS